MPSAAMGGTYPAPALAPEEHEHRARLVLCSALSQQGRSEAGLCRTYEHAATAVTTIATGAVADVLNVKACAS